MQRKLLHFRNRQAINQELNPSITFKTVKPTTDVEGEPFNQVRNHNLPKNQSKRKICLIQARRNGDYCQLHQTPTSLGCNKTQPCVSDRRFEV